MVIPILMHIYSFPSNWNVASGIKLHKDVRHPTKCDVLNNVKLFTTVSQDIMSHIFNVIQPDKSKCIRICHYVCNIVRAPPTSWRSSLVFGLSV